MPNETLTVPAAPTLPEDDPGQNTLSHLLPLTGVLGSMTMVVGMGPGGSAGRGLLMAGALLLSTCAVVLAQVARQRMQRRRTIEQARTQHLHRLEAVARLLGDHAEGERDAALHRWPSSRAAQPSAAAAHPERLDVRIGTCEVEHPIRLLPEEPGPGTPDPVSTDALARFADAHGHVSGMPYVVDLCQWQQVVLAGPDDQTEAATRAFLLACASSLPVKRITIALLCAPSERARWDWTKWLPHTAGSADDVTAPRLVDHRAAHLVARADPGRHLLVVATAEWSRLNPPLAAAELPPAHTVVTLQSRDAPSPHAPGRLHLALHLGDDVPSCPATVTPEPPRTRRVRVELCTLAEATAWARRLIRRPPPALTSTLTPTPAHFWENGAAEPRTERDLLRVEIGTDARGAALHLDLKEAAQGGHGPHGLLVGATGSGKSELLRTWVTLLASTHVPDDLALVLVDFKGGATFSELSDLPHVAACVTNLCDDVSLVDRMHDALTGEMERRQQDLHVSGHPSITAYRAARAAGAALAPMPHLFICVDEFSELLAARPEFVDLFTAIGRLGRSLGLHLLLSSQRLDDGRLHAVEAHLSYRIALRTFSAQESRAAIGAPDAHTLPRRPGVGLVRTGADELVQFDAHHLGAPVPGSTSANGPLKLPVLFTAAGQRGSLTRSGGLAPTTSGLTAGELLTTRLREAAAQWAPTRRIWLPPLAAPVRLAELLGPLTVTPERGLHAPGWSAPDVLRIPIGVVDLPRQHRHEPLMLTLDGAQGHVAIIGAPRSGRSTSVQTLICALALTRTPLELAVHLIDLSGGGLRALTDLPHVVSFTGRGQGAMLERVVAETEAEIARREEHPPDSPTRIALVVDGWGTLRAEHDDLERRLVALAPRALAVGVHLVVTGLRWSDLRAPFLDVVASHVELRLGDPFDTLVDRRAAAAVPVDHPGRGIAVDGDSRGHNTLLALPWLEAPSAPEPDDTTGCAHTVHAIASNWSGPISPRWKDLPEDVPWSLLDAPIAGSLRVGIDAQGHTLAMPATGHLVIAGPSSSGRTTALRTNVAEWVRDTAGQVVLIDPRGSLTGLVPEAHLLAHASAAEASTATLNALAETLTRRLDGHTSRGPHVPVTVAIDDLDLARDLGIDLSALTPLLPRAEAVGLRLTVACRTETDRVQNRWADLLETLGAHRLTLNSSPPGRAFMQVKDACSEKVQTTRPIPSIWYE